jgi:amino acid adenylation domain-containing protein
MKNVEDVYGLTPLQQGMLFHTLYNSDSGVYVEHISWTLNGELNVAAFERSWQVVIDHHPILRTAFFVERLDEPVQVVRKEASVPIEHLDWSALTGDEQQAQLDEFIEADRMRGFDTTKAPLIRVTMIRTGESSHTVVWSHHHILLDGWSTSLVLRDLLVAYKALCEGKPPVLENVRPYRDYIAWLQQRGTAAADSFWRSMLEGFSSPTSLRIVSPRGSLSESEDRPESQQVRVSAGVTAALQALARQSRVTVNTIVQGAWALLLSRYSGENDVVFGSIVSGRPTSLPGSETMVGLFLNALPVRAKVTSTTALIPWLQDLQAQQARTRQFEQTPLADIQRWSDVPQGLQLFDSTLAFESFPVEEMLKQQQDRIEIKDYVRYGGRSNYPINVAVEPGRELLLEIGYDRLLTSPPTVARMLGNFKTLLERFAERPEGNLGDYSMLSEDEYQQIIVKWNNSDRKFYSPACANLAFEKQVERTPDAVALHFEGTEINYRELNARANQLAHYLIALGVGPEVRVAILVERSIEMIVAALGVLKAGGAYVPMDPTYPQEWLGSMIEDAEVPIILTQEKFEDALPVRWTQVVCLDSDWEVIAKRSDENPTTAVQPQNLAYLVYTSGSTGKPKGVMLEHQGLCNIAESHIRLCAVNPESRVLQFASFSFDGSISEIFMALLAGASLYIAPRESVMPGRSLSDYLRRHRITIATFAPSALAVTPDADLPDLQTVLTFGEACPADLAERWASGRRFMNGYGPTEGTVGATLAQIVEIGKAPPIGRPFDNVKIYILGADGHPTPVGVPGELYIGGTGVARGYINQPDMTAQKFIPDPFSNTPGARLYRTGDLGTYRADGQIEFIGRIDYQVKIRGYRVEIGTVEAALASLPPIREVAVIVKEDESGSKRLVAYITPEPGISPTADDLRLALRKKLPDYMLPSLFVLLDEMPVTPNGKIDRRALKEPGLDRPYIGPEYAPPRNAAEEIMAAIWSRVLNVERVGIDDSFFSLGGDSIRSVQILAKAQERGWNLTLSQLFELQTIREVAATLETKEVLDFKPTTQPFEMLTPQDATKLPDGVEDAYPLTRLQQGMIFLAASRPDTAVYHSIMSFHLRGDLDVAALKSAAQALVARHAILRTSFDLYNFSEPLQLVHKVVDVPIIVEDISGMSEQEQESLIADRLSAERHSYFAWTEAPLLRFIVHKRSDRTFQVTLTASHAIMDGWSDTLFLTELSKNYAQELSQSHAVEPPLNLRFRDYVRLEQEALRSEECRTYWHEKLSGSALARLPRWPAALAPRSGKKFAQVEISFSEDLSKELIKLQQASAVPLKSVLLACHLKVLSIMSGERDVMTGLVSSARPEQQDGDRIIGLFLNTLPFRVKLKDSNWSDLVEQVFENEKELLPYRYYPLATIQVDGDGQPLFETCFNFTHFHHYQKEGFSGNLELLDVEAVAETDFALMTHFSLDPLSSLLNLTLGYDAVELCEAQVQAIADYYQKTLEAMVGNPQKRHESYTPVDLADLAAQSSQAATTGEPFAAIHSMLESRVADNPNATALLEGGLRITYEELNRRSNQLAHYLIRTGVKPGDVVGVCLDRSIDAVTALLGVLKSGAAYLPLDPDYPSERLQWMVNDSGARLVISKSNVAEVVVESVIRLDIDSLRDEISREADSNPQPQTVYDLAYIIYTSGSTGRPKGVMGTHAGALNRFQWMWAAYPFAPGEVCCQKTSLSFVDSVWEIFGPLLAGVPSVIIGSNDGKDPRKLIDILAAEQVTRIVLVPSLLRVMFENSFDLGQVLPRLKFIVSSGEALPSELGERVLQLDPPRTLINLYGSSEVSADATYYQLGGGAATATVPIGRPIANTRAYVLDRYLRPVPTGVVGELYVGGLGLARGYIGASDLTAERFVPDGFAIEAGERLYKTGDLARLLPGGDLEYMGRSDNQLKVRGFRVEVEEIESVLTQHATVTQACVVASAKSSGDTELVCYIVTNQDEGPTVGDLRAFLRTKLPDYMIPSSFVVVDEIPLLPNGKVNRIKLASLQPGEALAQEQPFVPPRTTVEELVADIWAQVLGVDQVGVLDNFFDLGGNSLMITQILSRVRAVFGIEIPLPDLVREPTVERLAQAIEAELTPDMAVETALPDAGMIPS